MTKCNCTRTEHPSVKSMDIESERISVICQFIQFFKYLSLAIWQLRNQVSLFCDSVALRLSLKYINSCNWDMFNMVSKLCNRRNWWFDHRLSNPSLISTDLGKSGPFLLASPCADCLRSLRYSLFNLEFFLFLVKFVIPASRCCFLWIS